MDKKGQIDILDLPNEILFRIFCLLTIQDVQQNVALVCKRFFFISRMNGMVTTFEMQLNMFSDEMEVKKHVSKIELLFKHHPPAQLKLEFQEKTKTESHDYDNFCLMEEFSLLTQSIKTMKFVFTSNFALLRAFSGEITPLDVADELDITCKILSKFKRREEMDFPTIYLYILTSRFPDESNKFNNLKSLTVNFYFQYFVSRFNLLCNKILNISIFQLLKDHRDFFNKISEKCKKLEKLFYHGGMSFQESLAFNQKTQEDEVEFASLSNLSVCFLSNKFIKRTQIQELSDYFIRKCPKLNGVLKHKLVKKEFFAIYGRCE